MNLEQLYNSVKSGEIIAALTANGKKHRFFIGQNENLCRFAPRSSRNGYRLTECDIRNYERFIGPKMLTEDEKLKKQYRLIAKYKKMAAQASFTNPFIRACLTLPDFETWKNDLREPESWEADNKTQRPKTLYDLHITTGTNIDGKVISLDRIAKKYPSEIARFRECIRTKTAGSYLDGFLGRNRGKFAGYDISISTEVRDNGDFHGFLSLEYAGCGNGYYYLLINDDNFIGYDVD